MENFIASLQQTWLTLQDKFYATFIEDNRWQYFTNGLKTTLLVTFFAVLIGIVLGIVVAVIRSSYDKNRDVKVAGFGPRFGRALLKIGNFLCKVYLTIIRGTPVVVQLMIIYFVIFTSRDASPLLAAIIGFGVNSGAYVAEIVRSGIMSIDPGQFEAGRSLGFNYVQTMWHIVIPQAIKNILPAWGNEFIVLLKETSVAGFITLTDLTKAGNIVQGRTYDALMPLLAVAVIYLVLVIILQAGVNWLERRLRSNER